MKGLLITLNQMVHTLLGITITTGANGADMSAQAPATNNVAPSADQANQVQSQEVEAPQNAQTQQPQASTSNNSQVTATPTESKASEGSSVNVNDHLKQIAQRESGGNIHAVNPTSGAAGKYQFLQSTWDSVAPAKYKVYHQQMLLKVFKMPQQ